jgi:nicotinic acid mononucleotide adenylyltransferase
LRLLIGADQAAQFHRWKRAREIVEIAEPVVMARGPRGSAEGLMEEMARGGFWTAEELAAWRARVVGGEVMDVSSTAVRSALCGSERSPAAETEPAVMEYIRERGLYRDR